MSRVIDLPIVYSVDDERTGQQRYDIPPPISELKLRRYSSCEKLLVGDSLGVAKNDKINRMMMRNGKKVLSLWTTTCFATNALKVLKGWKLSLYFPGEYKVLFSDMVVKVNHRYKPQDRFLVISGKSCFKWPLHLSLCFPHHPEGSLYNLDPLTLKCKRRISITDVTHVSLSQLADNFFVVHVPMEYDYLYVSRFVLFVCVLSVGLALYNAVYSTTWWIIDKWPSKICNLRQCVHCVKWNWLVPLSISFARSFMLKPYCYIEGARFLQGGCTCM